MGGASVVRSVSKALHFALVKSNFPGDKQTKELSVWTRRILEHVFAIFFGNAPPLPYLNVSENFMWT